MKSSNPCVSESADAASGASSRSDANIATAANDAFLISVSLLERMLRTCRPQVPVPHHSLSSLPSTVQALVASLTIQVSGPGLGLEISGLDSAIPMSGRARLQSVRNAARLAALVLALRVSFALPSSQALLTRSAACDRGPPDVRISLLAVAALAAFHNGESTRVTEVVQRRCDGGRVISWQTTRNGLRSG